MNKRRRKYNGQNPLPHGRPAVLSQREEASVAEAIIVAATWGYPFTTLEVREFVKKYLIVKELLRDVLTIIYRDVIGPKLF